MTPLPHISSVEDHELCLRLLSTRFSELQLNRCTVRNSTIPNGGNGLFASRNIKNGELITLYPGDAVIIRKNEDEDGNKKTSKDSKKKNIPLITNVMFGDHIDIKDRKIDRILTYESRGYETELNDSISIIGDPTFIPYDTSYCAHYANDGAYLNDFDATKREVYYTNSVSNYNSANFLMEDGAHVGMVATKDIGKNQEIFLSYGEGYWLSRISSDLKNNNSGNNGNGNSSSNGAAATTTTKEEADNMLTDIMSDMSERRKNVVNKKATTLTSSSMLTSSAVATATATAATGSGGGFKKSSSDNNANKNKKNKTKNRKKTTTNNSNTSSTSSKGFAK
ncbi:hypothetical protein FRACYDRAFT_259425 [Fragilariopsis cylindrus CCMP1102]|uniref:SET domain-containing protein n=1 Tax=Fragilariopsis cylindrus CCMP1102 TaxID=635003 RepID=A0A1E7FZK3_9STRA|nr:hypothetical protein FRACYDRAFT_259425 [Fragilariopsis cylindrus CCMP1102]|eukprot:OEU23589.1 hypothetical protein FRACYDRAFT_259425 [Fragilariopsis cylindrus CCMP1102]